MILELKLFTDDGVVLAMQTTPGISAQTTKEVGISFDIPIRQDEESLLAGIKTEFVWLER